MYITRLHVRNVKLLRGLSLDLTHEARPRMWTVFFAENGACKTTLLQAIALAASGAERANQLVDVPSLPDLRQPAAEARISADFEFGNRQEKWRRFPEPNLFAKSKHTLRLRSSLDIRVGQEAFSGDSWFAPTEVLASVVDEAPQLNAEALLAAFRGKTQTGSMERNLKLGLSGVDSTFFWQMLSYAFTRKDQISEARAKSFPGWFIVGYGTQRHLGVPGETFELRDRFLNRLGPLFGKTLPTGTGFASTFTDTHYLEPFLQALRQVLVEHHLLPDVEAVELSSTGGAAPPGELSRAHGFAFTFTGQQKPVPGPWLSQGYQATISWLADFIGQMYLDVGKPIPFEDMEGLVLIDELDLHLHPAWQMRLVPVLKRVFPRMQFIVTTHSPMILPALEPHEIIRLRRQDSGDVVAESLSSTSMLDFVTSPRSFPLELGEQLRRYASLSSDPTRSAAEDQEMLGLRARLTEVGLELGLPPVPRKGQ